MAQLGGEPMVLRNEGGNKHNWMRIDLKGLNDNKNGIGTKVELYAGTLYQKWEVAGASGYLGQNATSIVAGLGTEQKAEVVRLLWPTGVPQDEVNLAANKAHSLGELDRRGSSCPILFSWNGREYEFFPNERFVSAPPFPEFRVIASRDTRAPVGAWDDRGNDVLGLISKRDRKYVTDFEDLPFAGFAKLHWVELDVGEWDAKKPLRFIIDGYTDYFTATSMYAADQAGIKVIAPYVEALDAQGKWVRVVEDMGFPAGLERTMMADLTGKLLAGTRRIRVVNNLRIYWDAIRIDQT